MKCIIEKSHKLVSMNSSKKIQKDSLVLVKDIKFRERDTFTCGQNLSGRKDDREGHFFLQRGNRGFS